MACGIGIILKREAAGLLGSWEKEREDVLAILIFGNSVNSFELLVLLKNWTSFPIEITGVQSKFWLSDEVEKILVTIREHLI